MRTWLERAVALGGLRPIDLHRALLCGRLDGSGRPEMLLAAALLSRATGDGHSCLPLEMTPFVLPAVVMNGCPSTVEKKRLHRALADSPAVGAPGENKPLILTPQDRLYLHRHHYCERAIAHDLFTRGKTIETVDPDRTCSLLKRLFPGEADLSADQRLACAIALTKRLLVVSGGPGTGKTYLAARILALLQAMAPTPETLRIALCAPTGKAANRLRESIRLAKAAMEPDLSCAIPGDTQTIHRLLGVRGRGEFRHNRQRPLLLDLLILDEASMIDIELMTALLEALPAEARLILLGDRDQLASVEAGSLFGDLCQAFAPGRSPALAPILSRLAQQEVAICKRETGLADSMVHLSRSRRFDADSAIGRLAAAINQGNPAALEQAADGREVTTLAAIRESVETLITEHLAPVFSARDPMDALQRQQRFRILCCLREGRNGVAGINALIEDSLRRRRLISESPQYGGQPLLITRNDYRLQLFNGDVGTLWPDSSGRLMAWFISPGGEPLVINPARLPSHETAYAMTVHKAQGSEFHTVLVLLPEQDNPLLTRELLYTAVTRASRTLLISDPAALFGQAVTRRIERWSGLAAMLEAG